MKNQSLFTLFLLIGGSLSLFSCKKDISPTQEFVSETALAERKSGNETFWSRNVVMGHGTVRSFIRMQNKEIPGEIGIEISRSGIEGLDEHDHGHFNVSLPEEAKNTTPFDHMVIDWNPHGHPPFFYLESHFDFHFYTIGEKKRTSIPEYNEHTASRFDKLPAPGYIPSAYVPTPGGEAEMGKHWVDLSSPEFQPGGHFSSTMIYGSYDGDVVFLEPMITKNFIANTTNFSKNFPHPKYFSDKSKYFPTRYNVYKANNKYYITMTDFIVCQ